MQTCDIAKQELQKRFENEKKQHKALKANFTNQTANWIQEKKGMKMMEEKERQEQVMLTSYESRTRDNKYLFILPSALVPSAFYSASDHGIWNNCNKIMSCAVMEDLVLGSGTSSV